MADDDFVGPPQKTPFDDFSPEQRAHWDNALRIADGIKLYKAAGGIGVGGEWAPYAVALEKRGGLDEQEALNLSRYRMWKQGMPVPSGELEPEMTPEQIEARRNAFMQGTPQQRASMLLEDKAAIVKSHQRYFDNLIGKKKPAQAKPAEAQPES